jgi:hypothetical protein
MAKKDTEVIVRAYDLGGFGDVAGAMRMASYLSRQGFRTKIKSFSPSALSKLQILNPDVTFGNGDIDNEFEHNIKK